MRQLFEAAAGRARGLWLKARGVAKRSPVLTDAYGRGKGLYNRLRVRGVEDRRDGGVDPANEVWIFDPGRSGSTWLRRMMGEMPGDRVWE